MNALTFYNNMYTNSNNNNNNNNKYKANKSITIGSHCCVLVRNDWDNEERNPIDSRWKSTLRSLSTHSHSRRTHARMHTHANTQMHSSALASTIEGEDARNRAPLHDRFSFSAYASMYVCSYRFTLGDSLAFGFYVSNYERVCVHVLRRAFLCIRICVHVCVIT